MTNNLTFPCEGSEFKGYHKLEIVSEIPDKDANTVVVTRKCAWCGKIKVNTELVKQTMTNTDTHRGLDDKALREALDSILHLNGCQQYTNGWNTGKKGKDLDMKDVDRLEKLTLKEVFALVKEQQQTYLTLSLGNDTHIHDGAAGDEATWEAAQNSLRAEIKEKYGTK